MLSKKFINSLVLAGILAISLAIPVFASEKSSNGGSVALDGSADTITPYTIVKVDGGLGEWSYGTGAGWVNGEIVKTVYSNLNHGSKTHRSSCSIDTNYNNSDWVPARQTSRSSTYGPTDSTAYCNWDVK